jgi:DNA-binding transcriptional MerR regulator
MKIGELASRTGLAASRIRFYEASGLIQAQRQPNGYREYAPQTVGLIEIITSAQRAGFALEEVRNLLPAPPNLKGWKHDKLLASLRAKVTQIDAMRTRLRQNKAQLLLVIDQIENEPEGLQCDDKAARVIASLSNAQPPGNASPQGKRTTRHERRPASTGRTRR